MDFHQLTPQIGTAPASGELQAFGAGNSLGAPSQERGFSSVLRAASQRVEARREAKSHASQTERKKQPSTSTSEVQRSLSRKTDGSSGTKLRVAQSQADDRSSGKVRDAAGGDSRKTDRSTEAELRVAQSKPDDQPATSTSDVLIAPLHETSSSTDTESHISLAEIGDAPSSTTSGSDPSLISLVGATMVTPTATPDSTQDVASSDTSTSEVDGRSVLSGSTMSQPTSESAKGGASPVSLEFSLGDPVVQHTASATEDTVAMMSLPTSEAQPGPERTDTDIPVVVQSDKDLSLTAQQGQTAEGSAPDLGLPIKEHQERVVSQAPVPSGQAVVQEQKLAQQAATMTDQLPRQNGEEVEAESDWSPAQQIPGKGELSLRQQHREAVSSEAQSAAAMSGRMPAEGQGFNPGSDGQKKDDGLKWLSRVDLQSAEVSSRASQPTTSEPVDGGNQYSSYQQGQGGAPSNLRPASASSVPVPPQTTQLSPDPESTPIPRTQSVQFDLAPADFGQLRVRVVLSDRTIHTHMSTDRAELGQMLTGQQEQLSTQLTAAGLDLGRFQVQVDQERTNHSGEEWQSQAHNGTSHQQRDPRQQDPTQEPPVPSQRRTGILSLFA